MEQKPSVGAQLLLRRAELNEAYDDKKRIAEAKIYYEQTDALELALQALRAGPHSLLDGSSKSASLEDSPLFAITPPQQETEPGVYAGSSLPNGYFPKDEAIPGVVAPLKAMSRLWLQRLSSREALAVADYAGSNFDVLFITPESEDFQQLSQAVAKAPRFEEVTVYSGTSGYVQEFVEKHLAQGSDEFHLNSFLSTTPHAPEAARHSFNYNDELELALAIETSEGASLIAASGSPGELEILLPPGHYSVLGSEEVTLARKRVRLLKLRFSSSPSSSAVSST